MTGRRPLSVACPRCDAGAIRKVVEVVAMTRCAREGWRCPHYSTEGTSALAFSTSVPLSDIKAVGGRGPTQVSHY